MPGSPRVLVIDDDIDIRTLLELMLGSAGFSVLTAANGQEGLKAARLARPSVIILDLMMPIMDGTEFRRHQRADPQLCATPVVVTSAANHLQQRAVGLDAVAVLQKPLDFDMLVRVVADACQHT